MRSIRRALSVSLLSILLLAGLTAAALAYFAAIDESEELFDAEMAQMARLIHDLAASHEHDFLPVLIDPGQDWAPAHPYEKKLAYRILLPNGSAVARSPSFPDWVDTHPIPGYRTLQHQDEQWQLFSLVNAEPEGPIIQVIQSIRIRQELATKIALTNTLPILLCLPIMGVAIWWFIGLSLRPLARLSQQVSARGSGHLEPVELADTPSEIHGLVTALNQLLDRLKHSFERERRFTSDAAHELRTPLAGLQIHCENLCQDLANSDQLRSCQSILQGLGRMNRVVEQLLELSRLDPQQRLPESAPIDLIALCREVINDQIAFAIAHRIDLGLDAPSSLPPVAGHPLYLSLLLRNLVENALRYTPPQGEVTLKLTAETAGVKLQVIDSGPGLSDEQKRRAFERFYRAPQQSTTGTGLGLSIVRQIADLHDAKILLLDRPDGHSGLIAEVQFRCLPHSAPLVERA